MTEVRCLSCHRLLGKRHGDGTLEVAISRRLIVLVRVGSVQCDNPECADPPEVRVGAAAAGGGNHGPDVFTVGI